MISILHELSAIFVNGNDVHTSYHDLPVYFKEWFIYEYYGSITDLGNVLPYQGNRWIWYLDSTDPCTWFFQSGASIGVKDQGYLQYIGCGLYY